VTIEGGNPNGVELTAEQLATIIGASVAEAVRPFFEKLDALSASIAGEVSPTKPWDGESV
jgi:hypothetical protein